MREKKGACGVLVGKKEGRLCSDKKNDIKMGKLRTGLT